MGTFIGERMNIQTELSKQGINYKGKDVEVIDTTTERFKLIRGVVRNLEKSHSYNKSTGSYLLKHMVEKYLSIMTDGEINHVYNGEVIKAMELEGFSWQAMSENSLNAWFKVSKTSIKNLFKEN